MEDRAAAPRWAAYEIADLLRRRQESGRLYLEFLRVPALSAGVYELAAGAADPQRPHTQDELYYVIAGRARFRADGEETAVGPGTVLYVEAEVEHRFFDIAEDLQVLVFFAPAEE